MWGPREMKLGAGCFLPRGRDVPNTGTDLTGRERHGENVHSFIIRFPGSKEAKGGFWER